MTKAAELHSSATYERFRMDITAVHPQVANYEQNLQSLTQDVAAVKSSVNTLEHTTTEHGTLVRVMLESQGFTFAQIEFRVHQAKTIMGQQLGTILAGLHILGFPSRPDNAPMSMDPKMPLKSALSEQSTPVDRELDGVLPPTPKSSLLPPVTANHCQCSKPRCSTCYAGSYAYCRASCDNTNTTVTHKRPNGGAKDPHMFGCCAPRRYEW